MAVRRRGYGQLPLHLRELVVASGQAQTLIVPSTEEVSRQSPVGCTASEHTVVGVRLEGRHQLTLHQLPVQHPPVLCSGGAGRAAGRGVGAMWEWDRTASQVMQSAAALPHCCTHIYTHTHI